MKRYIPVLIILLGLGLIAWGQSTALVLQSTMVDQDHYFGRDNYSKGQRVLVNGDPGIHGLGPSETILTSDGTTTTDQWFVQTVDFHADAGVPRETGEADGGDVGPIESITIDGNQTVDTTLQEAVVIHGVGINSKTPRVHNVQIRNFRGTLLRFQGDSTFSGFTKWGGAENFHLSQGFIGIEIGGSDQHISEFVIAKMRDAGIFNNGANSQLQISDGHLFQCAGQTTGPVYDGKCIDNTSGSYWHFTNVTMEASHFGYYGTTAHRQKFVGCHWQRCSKGAVTLITSTGAQFVGCTFELPKSRDDAEFDDPWGIHLDRSARCHISDSYFQLSTIVPSGTPGNDGGVATAIRVTDTNGVNGAANSIADCTFDDFGVPAGQARGIHLVGAVKGFVAKGIKMWGFEDAGDVFLHVESENAVINVEIHGNSADTDNFPPTLNDTTLEDYVILPANWQGSVVFFDDATDPKTGHALTEGVQYPTP